MHELLHGLGFITSWYPWLGNNVFLPSFPVYHDNGTLSGLSKPFIFDKFLADSLNGFWMRDYASVITHDLSKSIEKGGELLWLQEFLLTQGGQIASSLNSPGSPFLTLRGTWFWFPFVQLDQLYYKYAILYTPSEFDSGSSLSHLDDDFYLGTSQFLMKPFATKGVGLDGVLPFNPLGPLSEIVLGVLRAMGYTTVMV
jgi:hypothetical protein